MRKSTIKKVSLAPKKATVVQAKRVVKPVVTVQAEIDKALVDMTKEDKERELLTRELEKPMKQRNKALMEKYNVLDGSKLADNYPDLSKGVNYELDVHFPEDDGVKVEERPKPWFVGLTIEWQGNKFNYRFPIHASTYHDGQSLYKLDGFSVYVDHDAVIKNDISEYTIFQALTDYHAGTLRNGQVNDLFYKYKVITEEYIDEDILNKDVPKNFAIKGVFVTSKVIKGTAPTKTTVTSGNQLLQTFTVAEGEENNVSNENQPRFQTEVAKLQQQGGLFVPGLTTKLKEGVLILSGFDSVKTATDETPRYVFLYFDPPRPNNLYAMLAIGPSAGLAAAKLILDGVTKVNLMTMMQENNKSMYNQYSGNIAAEEQRIADLARAQQEADDLKKAQKKAKEEERKKQEEDDKRKKALDEKKRKDEEEAQKKKDAEDAKKKAAEEARAKAEYEDLLKVRVGRKQTVNFPEDGFTFYWPSSLENDVATELESRLQALMDSLPTDGLYVDGVGRRILKAYHNFIIAAHGSPDDVDGEKYAAVLEVAADDDESLVTHICLGTASLRRYFKMQKSSYKDLIEHLVKHNQDVFEEISKK